MLDKFIYVNHQGKRFEGLPNMVFLNYSSLRDYTWSYDTMNGRIARFYRSVTKRDVPLVICCNTASEARRTLNGLYDLVEADIEAMTPGRIYVGNYYTTGYITKSEKSKYLVDGRFCKITLALTSEDPAWYLETNYSFVPGEQSGNTTSTGTDYPYDYAYDYATFLRSRDILCESVGSGAFRLLIYGDCTNPALSIGDHQYTVTGAIGSGQTLLIDSTTKKITLTKADGKQENWFDHRGRESYIFEPIKPGYNTVAYNGTFGFDLTVISKRSEPKWI